MYLGLLQRQALIYPVEFLPAEILDNFIIRPFAMFEAPHYIHPYPIGFLVGKFSADIIFYVFAIIGYESRKALVTSLANKYCNYLSNMLE